MKDKINIAELLKDCPKGMELDCTMYDNITFCGINERSTAPINIKRKDGIIYQLTKYGQPSEYEDAKCVIFPKGKTTWEGFVPPCEFKDGDILSYQSAWEKNRTIYIYRHHPTMNTSYYVALGGDLEFMVNPKEGHALSGNNTTARLATEKEKEQLFQAIKDKGYKWNPKTKTLEKLIEPKFKVGNEIDFERQDAYKLVPNKFDITTLNPFDKVLVRDKETKEWSISLFSHCNSLEIHKYSCINGSGYAQCIPYEGNEHLLGTADDCDEFYKTWKRI